MILAGLLLLLCALAFLGYRHQKLLVRCALAEQKVKNQEELKESFRIVSAEALEKTNNTLFEAQQKDLEEKQKAIGVMVEKIHAQMRLLENERKTDHGAMKQQLHALMDAEHNLKSETSKLVKALRSPAGRGRWGEIQLKRVVELAGMLQHCDFFEQGYDMTEGQRRKPDLIVRLPGERQVIIDAKVPLEAYLDGVDTENETLRLEKFRQHARHVKDHITILGKKTYWEHFQPSPEFVVLFLPSETIFAIAMEADPALIEYGAGQGVIIATPTTLIALLRAVAYGWKQESLSRHAQKVSDMGHELYKRISDMSGHWAHVGKALDQAVGAFNQATGSLERNVLSSARRFSELGAASSVNPIKEIDVIETAARKLVSPEMKDASS
ncbi:MAG TPA: DNA recombination protein RmuC [Rhabdochlamydiaceae bacterium]|nr:DNA recombination protein RmuC [Rhabdochlamydiaceae bacterium]